MIGAMRKRPVLLLPIVLAAIAVRSAAAKGYYYGMPENCKRLECPKYDVVHSQAEFEIRTYGRAMWMSTSSINSSSYTDATTKGFNILFAYIQGKNNKGATIEMTAPVMVDVTPSAGPFCDSSFKVHFYVPKEYQQAPPTSNQVLPTKLPAHRYAAVRRFGGFMDDSDIAPQVSALRSSLKGTQWEASLQKQQSGGYSVAGYNSPFEYEGRVNEVMLWFD